MTMLTETVHGPNQWWECLCRGKDGTFVYLVIDRYQEPPQFRLFAGNASSQRELKVVDAFQSIRSGLLVVHTGSEGNLHFSVSELEERSWTSRFVSAARWYKVDSQGQKLHKLKLYRCHADNYVIGYMPEGEIRITKR